MESTENDGVNILSAKELESLEQVSTVEMVNEATSEEGFSWDAYLELTSSLGAPEYLFPHVEASIRNGFQRGMTMEVVHADASDTYWPVTVLMSCGQLLKLQWDGHVGQGQGQSVEFWADAFSLDIHPLGWCKDHGKVLRPPPALASQLSIDRLAANTATVHAPSYLFCTKRCGVTPADQFREGTKVEVQHELDPLKVWQAVVTRNVGGRLRLAYVGATDSHFWLFYLHNRLHPIGWARQHGCVYSPPPGVAIATEALETCSQEPGDLDDLDDVFEGQEVVANHSVSVGWKVEVIDPVSRGHVCPATVCRIVNDTYYIVEVDQLSPLSPGQQPLQLCCHGNSTCVLPVNWARDNNVLLVPPAGRSGDVFSWSDYLTDTNSQPAPAAALRVPSSVCDMEAGMKLEAVSATCASDIVVATVSHVLGDMLVLTCDVTSRQHIVCANSLDIFPPGWSLSNKYPLIAPSVTPAQTTTTAISTRSEQAEGAMEELSNGKGGRWCPRLYFRPRCYTGPHLCKARVLCLPRSVGPGPLSLVLNEVLSMVINVAYKPRSVLHDVQLANAAYPQPLVVKAKSKGRSMRALVNSVKSVDEVDSYLRHLCRSVNCCVSLITSTPPTDTCPHHCMEAKKSSTTAAPAVKRFKAKASKPVTQSAPTSDVASSNTAGESAAAGASVSQDETVDGPHKYSRHLLSAASPMITRGVHASGFRIHTRAHRSALSRYSYRTAALRSDSRQHAHLDAQHSHRRHHHVPHPHRHHDNNTGNKQHSASSTQQPDDQKHPGMDVVLTSNPLEWSVDDVVRFIQSTDCAGLAWILRQHNIDGRAMLLLTLAAVEEFLELRHDAAVRLCIHIEGVKMAFYRQFACVQ